MCVPLFRMTACLLKQACACTVELVCFVGSRNGRLLAGLSMFAFCNDGSLSHALCSRSVFQFDREAACRGAYRSKGGNHEDAPWRG
jgi:hypothetical protein